MLMDKRIADLIADLEYYIGSECYNPNSYDGWNDIAGCDYRYPITMPRGDGSFQRIRGRIRGSALIQEQDITPETIKYMKYRFGANELFVGLGLIKILEHLEERYGIDFNKLEAEAETTK